MRLILAIALLSVACHHKSTVAPLSYLGSPITDGTNVTGNTLTVDGGLAVSPSKPFTGTFPIAGNISTLDNGVCSICKKLGKKSTVTMSMSGTSTAVMCTSYLDRYDENGHLLPKGPDCNTFTRYGECSNGHRVIETR